MAELKSILLVEDNEHDQVAFQRAFSKQKQAVSLTMFETADQALAELARSPHLHDIVVSDYDLPGSNGFELCKSIMGSHPHLALVLLTGRGSENLAVEALRAGVDDYLTKDPERGYLRLLPEVLQKAVNRREDILARARAEKALQKSERRYRHLVENSPAIVYSFSSEKGGFYASGGVEHILGYTPEHLSQNPFVWQESIHPDDLPLVHNTIESCEQGKSFSIEYRIRDFDGKWHWFLDRSISIQIRDGQKLIEGLATDITAIKQLVAERDQAIAQLQDSLEQIKQLSGLLPICANCKKIRNDQGYWLQVENYISDHTGVEFSHGICPACMEKLYPEMALEDD